MIVTRVVAVPRVIKSATKRAAKSSEFHRRDCLFWKFSCGQPLTCTASNLTAFPRTRFPSYCSSTFASFSFYVYIFDVIVDDI